MRKANQWPIKSVNQRLDENIDKSSGCWVWKRCLTKAGYGQLRECGITHYTHRLMWERFNGPITNGLNVLHRCDNPPCCNPDHLFLGTQKDNGQDMSKKKRSTYGERSSQAKLKENQVLEIRESKKPVRLIAGEFGISTSHVYSIKRGIEWSYLRAAA